MNWNFVSPQHSKINRACILSEFKLQYGQLMKHKQTFTDALEAYKARPVDLADTYCGSNIDKSDFYWHHEHLNAVKPLQNNNNIILSKPNKDTGVVILNKQDYNKMVVILHNTAKFTILASVDFDKTTLKQQQMQSELLRFYNEHQISNLRDNIPVWITKTTIVWTP